MFKSSPRNYSSLFFMEINLLIYFSAKFLVYDNNTDLGFFGPRNIRTNW